MFISSILRILGRTCYSPDDNTGLGDLDVLGTKDDDKVVPDADKDKDDDKDDDKDKTDDDDKKDDDKDDEESDDEEDEEGDDDDDEDKDDDEDDDDELPEDQLASVKDIKKDYPDFFKKHPEVKAAIFRDQRFSEILGTPEEAETAVKRSSTLAAIEQDLFVDGNPGKLLETIKKSDEKAYKRTIFGMISHLQEKDRDLYIELGALPIKQLLRNAWREGKGDKTNLGKAAAWIHQYMFGKDAKFDEKVEAEGFKPNEKSQEQKDYEDRLSKLEMKEYNGFKEAVDSSYLNKMDRFLREDLDKDERLTEWAKSKIVNDTLEEIVKQLENDTRHKTALDSLWRNAKAAGFNSDFKSRIINTALVRAKSLAPKIRARLVNDALGKSKKRDDKKKDDKKDDKVVRHLDRKSNNDKKSNRDNVKKPLTDMDILRS